MPALLVLRQYLLLVRLPNTFTAPSNILAGYFAVISPSYANVSQLAILMLSSVLLYLSGIVFNDYFDIEIDLKKRPLRKNFEAKTSQNCHSFVGGWSHFCYYNRFD